MEHQSSRLAYLFELSCRQALSDEERKELDSLMEAPEATAQLDQLLRASWEQTEDDGSLNMDSRRKMAAGIIGNSRHRTMTLLFSWRSVAAAAAIVAGISVFKWMQPRIAHTGSIAMVADPAPGREGAILTLSDGSTVVLDSLKDGKLEQEKAGNAVLKNGQLAYQQKSEQQNGPVVYNSISTPRGRQYHLQLPDGSRVWLNAATTLRYPVAFNGKDRSVEVSGEAYFEIAQDVNKPFRVHFTSTTGSSKDGIVNVLGTSFNISAYQDDMAARVTLITGKVMVKPSIVSTNESILKPGQQAEMKYSGNNALLVQQADTARTLAWKNGMMNLHNMPLSEVMKQISRWYNIDVVYEDVIPDITFWGEISRSENLSTVLEFMAASGLKFKIDDNGRKLVVRKL
ncbi:FecR family protein [Chitinophaga sp. Hz27]|uniref:FecR family protein n=1 Tax=Chitinophaga sp. Hz27 TaxID=3347169 RepID=UPI0035DCA0A3